MTVKITVTDKPINSTYENVTGLIGGGGAGSGAEFEGSFNLNGTELIVEAKARFNKRIYTIEDWPSFSGAVKMQKLLIDNPVILKIEK